MSKHVYFFNPCKSTKANRDQRLFVQRNVIWRYKKVVLRGHRTKTGLAYFLGCLTLAVYQKEEYLFPRDQWRTDSAHAAQQCTKENGVPQLIYYTIIPLLWYNDDINIVTIVVVLLIMVIIISIIIMIIISVLYHH